MANSIRGAQKVWPHRRHGDLTRISDNVWRVVADVPGMLLKRQMVVARDDQQRLLLHSAIALDDHRLSLLQELGTPAWLVVPNGYHRLDAAAYKARFPELVVVTPSGALPRVREVVEVEFVYERFPANPTFRFHTPPWSNPEEGALEIRGKERTLLVFNDLIFNPAGSGSASWLYRWLRQRPQVPWLPRHMFAASNNLLRDWLLQLADIERLSMVIPGHGDPIAVEARATLRRIALSL